MRDIEEIIRDAWSPAMPEGMRERVLQRAREQYVEAARMNSTRRRWILWLAAAAIAFVLMANLIDSARSARLSVVVGLPDVETPTASSPGILEQRRQMERLLALSGGSGFTSSL
ncbi:MAG TPA: hypothetical protein VFJ58_07365 [Armatimonadota bacterium]|nr:hypothetical protein [Armatimonadota bacterium]